ncbi:hypothetical protein BKA82DRAFT_1008639, partial [Pisolithus tinctorius]
MPDWLVCTNIYAALCSSISCATGSHSDGPLSFYDFPLRAPQVSCFQAHQQNPSLLMQAQWNVLGTRQCLCMIVGTVYSWNGCWASV